MSKDRETGTPDRKFVIKVTRREVEYLGRMSLKMADESKKALDKLPPSSEERTKEQQDAFALLSLDIASFTQQAQSLADKMSQGDLVYLQNHRTYDELQDMFERVEDDATKQAILDRIKEMPKVEEHRIEFTRSSAKALIEILEKHIKRYRDVTIPEEEKKPLEEYTDPVQTKAFCLAVKRRDKDMLDQLRVRLEKCL